MSLQVTYPDALGRWPLGETSAEKPPRMSVDFELISVSGALVSQGTITSSLGALAEAWATVLEQTHSGMRDVHAASAGEQRASSRSALMELRRLSDLTWERLGELFGVSRRSLHFWASGKPQNSANEERLQRLLATLRRVDRGSARENRGALFEAQADGVIPFDLLVREHYQEVLDRLGPRAPRARAARRPLDREAVAARMLPKPEELVGAMQDTVHREVGKNRAARARRAKSR
jgi:DNA-binding transcriptional regulator YiaG